MGRICFGGFRISNRRTGSGHYFGRVAAPRVARDYESMLAILAGWHVWACFVGRFGVSFYCDPFGILVEIGKRVGIIRSTTFMINAVMRGGNIKHRWVRNGKEKERQQRNENQSDSGPFAEVLRHKFGYLRPCQGYDPTCISRSHLICGRRRDELPLRYSNSVLNN